MSGLRDRKKQQVRRRIIEVAERLFATAGIDGTTMDEIATGADVSVATVYNYFGSKTALLLAAVADDTDEMVEQGATVLAQPGADPRRAVKKLLAIYIDHLAIWDRDLLREVMAASFQQGGTELVEGLAQMDQRLLAQLTELLQQFERLEALRPGVSPDEAALLLFSTVVTHLFIFLSLDWLNADELRTQIARQIDLAFDGLTRTDEKKAT